MTQDYLPILLQAIVAIVFAAVALIFSVLLGKKGRRNPTKDSAYECGMLPIGPAQPRFSVKFYLVAMLFILFDLEIVFMYPWAIVYRELKLFAFFEMEATAAAEKSQASMEPGAGATTMWGPTSRYFAGRRLVQRLHLV